MGRTGNPSYLQIQSDVTAHRVSVLGFHELNLVCSGLRCVSRNWHVDSPGTNHRKRGVMEVLIGN